MTDPIGTAQERELIEWLRELGFEYSRAEEAADALQSRIAEVGRLTERVRELEAVLGGEATNEMVEAAATTPGMKVVDGVMVLHQARGNRLNEEAFRAGSPLHQAWRAMADAALSLQRGV